VVIMSERYQGRVALHRFLLIVSLKPL
jgi:hypothetical protein